MSAQFMKSDGDTLLVNVSIISAYTIIFVSCISYVYVMYAERYQIIFITITNNNFRFYYILSKLDQVLLLLLLINKLLLLR
jgi:hypothetical protein